MKKNKYILLPLTLLINILFLSCSSRENMLMDEGNDLSNKIEMYKIKKGRLPNTLSDIGFIEKEEGPLYYKKIDSSNYIIWFGTSLGESKTYYSDTKKWENR